MLMPRGKTCPMEHPASAVTRSDFLEGGEEDSGGFGEGREVEQSVLLCVQPCQARATSTSQAASTRNSRARLPVVAVFNALRACVPIAKTSGLNAEIWLRIAS